MLVRLEDTGGGKALLGEPIVLVKQSSKAAQAFAWAGKQPS